MGRWPRLLRIVLMAPMSFAPVLTQRRIPPPHLLLLQPSVKKRFPFLPPLLLPRNPAMPSDLGLLTFASVLRRGRQLDQVSASITVVALAWAMLQWPMGFGSRIGGALATLLVLVGILQKVWAARVALDADLFEALGQGGGDRANDAARLEATDAPGGSPGSVVQDVDLPPSATAADPLTAGLSAMDAMLVSTGLMPAARAGRPLAPRLQGALRLLVIQASLVGFQVALTLSSLLAMPWLFPPY